MADKDATGTDRAHADESAPLTKGEQTRALILATALRLFRERGYEQTTMRLIASEAGVSVGNAYHYFASKDELILSLYGDIQRAHAAAVSERLGDERRFSARLLLTLLAWLDVARPYHGFAGKFFRTAAEPTSPLSPFSEQSRPAREASISIYQGVLDGSDLRLDSELRRELPELLWLLQMGVVLFWVHDSSPEQQRSAYLATQIVPLIDRLVGLTRLPVIRGVSRQITDLVRVLKERPETS